MAFRICTIIWTLVLVYCDYSDASVCRSDEVWRLGFSPEPSCQSRFPIVNIYDFKEGCYCGGDHVRDPNGKCVAIEDCPAEVSTHHTHHTSKVCQHGEEWKIGYCPEPSCNDIFPILDYHDARLGCFCKDNHVRDSSGKCIRLIECPQYAHLDLPKVVSDHVDHVCPEGEYYGVGGYPEATCKNLHPIQYDEKTGCFCKDDYVRDINGGRCIPRSFCSSNASDLNVLLINNNILPLAILSTQDKSHCPCNDNEDIIDPDQAWRCEPGDIFMIDWFKCKCNPSGFSANCILDTTLKCPRSETYQCQCSENICGRYGPEVTDPTDLCRYGRYCKPGFARNAYGKCIPEEKCKICSKKH